MNFDKSIRIEEDQNKFLSPVLHYKRMMEELFDSDNKDQSLKRQIPLSFSIISEGQNIQGGISGWIGFDFAVLEVLWVDKNYRKKGLGKVLLSKLEDEAKKHQCTRILTSTNSYSDSLDFRLKNGFELLCTAEGKIQIHYLQKNLNS